MPKKRQHGRSATEKARKPLPPAQARSVGLARRESQGLAIQAPVQIVRAESAVPSVLNTVKSLENVRRFISRCLNTDLQRELAKLPKGQQLDKDVRKRLEVDWGTIPGVDKPFLLQPGAEKFCFWLHIRPKFFNREIDLGSGHVEIISKVVFYSKKTGEEVFEGPECSCTTMESNYRFRMQERPENEKPPERDEAKILTAKGLGKWKQKAEWKGGKKVGEKWVWMDRIENPNIYDERNKVRQIGEKRAMVKGVKNMGALSEIFVTNPDEWQIGDEPDEGPHVDDAYTEGGRKIVPNEPPPSPAESNWERREKEGMEKLTAEQKAVLDAKMKQAPQVKHEAPAEGQGTVRAEAVPCLFYRWFNESQTARVEPQPNLNLTADLKALIAKKWNGAEGAAVFNGEELEALKFEFQRKGVEVRRLS